MKLIGIVFFCVVFPCMGQNDEGVEQITRAKLAFSKGEYLSAKKILEPLTDLPKKSNNDRLMILAACEYQTKNLNEAVELYEEAMADGVTAAVKALALMKLEANELDWLDVNREKLEDRLSVDVDFVRVFAIWALKEKDLKILEFGISKVKDEDLIKHPRAAKTLLQVYRHFFTALLKESREARDREK